MHGRELFGCRKLYAFADFYQRTRLTAFERKTELNSRNDDIHHAAIRHIYGYRAKAGHFYGPLRVKYERWHVIKRHSYILINEGYGTRAAKTRRIQHGFDVDVYGIKTSNDRGLPATSPDYAIGNAVLRELTETISSHSTDNCSIEVTPFGSTEFLDPKDDLQASAKLQVRITHRRGLDQPAGLSEQQALEELEKQLRSLGITRRN